MYQQGRALGSSRVWIDNPARNILRRGPISNKRYIDAGRTKSRTISGLPGQTQDLPKIRRWRARGGYIAQRNHGAGVYEALHIPFTNLNRG